MMNPNTLFWGCSFIAVLIVVGVAGYFVVDMVKYRKTKNYAARSLAFVLAVALLLGVGSHTISELRIAAAADEADYQSPTGDAAIAAASAEEGRYAIDPTGAEDWRKMVFGDDLPVLRETVSENMWPISKQARLDALAEFRDASGRKPSYTDPANLPLGPTDTWKTRDLRDFYKLSVEDQTLTIDEILQKNRIRFQTDPINCLAFDRMWVTMNPQILEDNPWMKEFMDKFEEAIKNGDGVNTFFEVGKEDKIRLTNEAWNYCTYHGMLFDLFRNEGIQSGLRSEKSWTVNNAALRCDVDIIERKVGNDSWPCLVFPDRVKDGENGKDILIGKWAINMSDGSPELLKLEETTPENPGSGKIPDKKPGSNPASEDPSGGSSTEVVEYASLVIDYVLEGNIFHTYRGSVAIGNPYNVGTIAEAGAKTGYTPNRSTVYGTMVKGGVHETVDYNPNRHTVTVEHWDASNNKTFAPTTTTTVFYGRSYTASPVTHSGYSVDPNRDYSGTMPDRDLSFRFVYSKTTKQTGHLKILYLFENGREAAPPYEDDIPVGETFRRTSPSVTGYEPDIRVVSGEMESTAGKTFTVTYKPVVQKARLTVLYQFEDGTRAAPTHVEDVEVGKPYRKVSPDVAGYSPSIAVVEGDMVAGGVTVTVTYKRSGLYDLVINYRFDREDGPQAADPVEVQLREGVSYNYPSPRIDDYTADKPYVSGVKNAYREVWTVIYRPNNADVTVTVHYRYGETGEPAGSDRTWTGKTGDYYNIVTPGKAGYTADHDSISGYATQGDEVYTVFYWKNGTTPDGGGGKVETARPDKVSDGDGGTNADTFGGNNRVAGDGEEQKTDPITNGGQVDYTDPAINGTTSGSGNSGSGSSGSGGSSTSGGANGATEPPTVSADQKSDGKTSGTTGGEVKNDPTVTDATTGKVAENGEAPSTAKEDKPVVTDKVTGTELPPANSGGSSSGGSSNSGNASSGGSDASQGSGSSSGDSGAGSSGSTGGQHVDTSNDGVNRGDFEAPPAD